MTAGGLCFGAAVQVANEDSICVYNGSSPVIGADHKITVILYIENGYSGEGVSHENILGLRASINGTNNISYISCLFPLNSTLMQVFHHSGGVGEYTHWTDVPITTLANGDELSAQAVGQGAAMRVTLWQNGTPILVDFTPPSGNTAYGVPHRLPGGRPALSHFVNAPATPNKSAFTYVKVENV